MSAVVARRSFARSASAFGALLLGCTGFSAFAAGCQIPDDPLLLPPDASTAGTGGTTGLSGDSSDGNATASASGTGGDTGAVSATSATAGGTSGGTGQTDTSATGDTGSAGSTTGNGSTGSSVSDSATGTGVTGTTGRNTTTGGAGTGSVAGATSSSGTGATASGGSTAGTRGTTGNTVSDAGKQDACTTNACGGCGPLAVAINAPCGQCGHYVCSGGSAVCSDARGVKGVAMSIEHACAITSTGGLRCWGDNSMGQLGIGAPGDGGPQNLRSPPTTDVLTQVDSVAAGSSFTCAVLTSGGLRCWGDNSRGQLADGTFMQRATPPAADTLTGMRAVSAAKGSGSVCALSRTGDLFCWGYNLFGQVGNGTAVGTNGTAGVTSPYLVLSGVTAFNAGNTTCAVGSSSQASCWGFNGAGQVGIGQPTVDAGNFNVTTPAIVTSYPVQSIVGGDLHTCILASGGGVRCWGTSSAGQLGIGVLPDGGSQTAYYPPTTDVLTGVAVIAAGATHTCALTTSGGVRCWGDNRMGELGDGTTVSRSTPPLTDVLTGVKTLVAGFSNTCAIMLDGGLKCWGDNSRGQLGDGTTMMHPTPTDIPICD